MQMQVAGFQVEHRPFGALTTLPPPDDPFWNHRPVWHDWLIQAAALLRRLVGRKPVPNSVRGGSEPPTGRIYP